MLFCSYNRIERRAARVVTAGGQQPANKLAEQLRHECAAAGYTEALTFTLVSTHSTKLAVYYRRLGIIPYKDMHVAKVSMLFELKYTSPTQKHW